MGLSLPRTIRRVLSALSITGPIFAKELRVSSRRRRNYVLRSVYILLMLLVVVAMWYPAMAISRYASAWSVQRMGFVGKMIHMTIMWFQFVVAQLLAIILLSTAISDEIYNRTLGVLMTTPISSLQIVAGKLFSKLWQILVLLSLSVPLLALVRVFGGVEWGYLVSGMCITLTATIFAGMMSLYFSIHNRRAYIGIFKTLVMLGILYVGLPLAIGWQLIENLNLSEMRVLTVLFTFNPIMALGFETAKLQSLGIMGRGPQVYWPVTCGIMLAGSALVGALCVRVVRRAALAQATGQPLKRRRKKRGAAVAAVGAASVGRIRRVYDPPAIWKELRPRRHSRGTILMMIVVLATLVISYIVAADGNDLDDSDAQTAYIVILVSLAAMVTTAIAAGVVTSEKEARTWPGLLATTLSAREIIFAKVVGVLRRGALMWGLLVGHLAVFVLAGYIHPMVVLHIGMLAIWLTIFLTGVGIYFSTVLKRTTWAVVTTFTFLMALWAILPGILLLVVLIAGGEQPAGDLAEGMAVAHPTIQAIAVSAEACGEDNALRPVSNLSYNWPHDYSADVGETTTIMLISMVGYSLAGLGFMAAAAGRLRKRIY